MYRESKEFTYIKKADNVAGSAFSKTFWKHDRSEELWFAKYSEEKEEKLVLECLANGIYNYYGIKVARIAIVKLPRFCVNNEALSFEPSTAEDMVPYFFSRWLDRFSHSSIHLGDGYRKLIRSIENHVDSSEEEFIIRENRYELHEVGLGHILAVAYFIDDGDVIGPTGENIGFYLSNQDEKLYAHSCKIDPGCAFWGFYNEDAEQSIKQDKSLVISKSSKDPEFKFTELKFSRLPKRTKLEFLYTLKKIINTSPEIIESFFQYPGEDGKITNYSYSKKIVDWLIDRQQQLKDVFAEEIAFYEQQNDSLLYPTILAQPKHDTLFAKIIHSNKNLQLQKQGKECFLELDLLNNPYDPQISQQLIPSRIAFKEFLQDSTEKMLLLLGDGGAGKSTVAQNLAVKTWENALKEIDNLSIEEMKQIIIPIYIELKLFNSDTVKNCVENVLLDYYDLTEKQVNELKKHYRLLIILDGFDEIAQNQKYNLWESNNLSDWKDIKVLITSRITYLQDQDLSKYFATTINGITATRTFYLSGLSTEIITYYLKKNANQHKEYWEPIVKSGADIINLLSNPLLLKIFSKVLPELKIIQLSEGYDRQVALSKFDLYEALTNLWFRNANSRLILMYGTSYATPENFLHQFTERAKHLAFSMFETQKMVYVVNQDELKFLYEDFVIGCPLIRQNEGYSFIHRNFMEYFTAKKLWENIPIESTTNEKELQDQFFIVWGKRNIAEEPGIVDFLVNQFNTLSLDKKLYLKEKLMGYVRESSKDKTNIDYANVAAGIMTFLNKAKVSFAKENLKGINISGADLVGAILDSANLEGSILINVNLKGSWLSNANLKNCNLRGVYFGEIPYINTKKSVEVCLYSANEYLIAAGEYFISIYNLNFIVTDHTKSINTVKMKHCPIWVFSMAFNYKNNLLAVGGSMESSFEQKIYIYTFPNLENIRIISIPKLALKINNIFFSEDEELIIITIDPINKIYAWYTKDLLENYYFNLKAPSKYVEFPEELTCISVSLDNKMLSAGSKQFKIYLWNTADLIENFLTFKSTLTLDNYTSKIISLAISMDKLRLSSGHENNMIFIWDLNNRFIIYKIDYIHKINKFNSKTSKLIFSIDSKLLFLCMSSNEYIYFWKKDYPFVNNALSGHTQMVKNIAFSPNNQWVTSVGEDQAVRFWNFGELAKSHGINSFTCIYSIDFSFDCQWIATGDADCKVHLWMIINPHIHYVLSGHKAAVNSVSFSYNNNLLASGSDDQKILIWNIDNQQIVNIFNIGSKVLSVCFSQNNNWLSFSSEDKTICLYKISSTTEKVMLKQDPILLKEHDWPVYNMAFSPNNLWLITGSHSHAHTICLWYIENDLHIDKFKTISLNDRIQCVAFSSTIQQDNTILFAAGGKDSNKVYLYKLKSNKEVYEYNIIVINNNIKNSKISINSIAFNHNDEWLVFGGNGGFWLSKIHDYENEGRNVTINLCTKFIPTQFSINSVLYKKIQDRIFLATGGNDGSLRLWEENNNGYVILVWSTSQTILNADKLEFSGSYNSKMSYNNYKLLQQRGGITCIVSVDVISELINEPNVIFLNISNFIDSLKNDIDKPDFWDKFSNMILEKINMLYEFFLTKENVSFNCRKDSCLLYSYEQGNGSNYSNNGVKINNEDESAVIELIPKNRLIMMV